MLDDCVLGLIKAEPTDKPYVAFAAIYFLKPSNQRNGGNRGEMFFADGPRMENEGFSLQRATIWKQNNGRLDLSGYKHVKSIVLREISNGDIEDLLHAFHALESNARGRAIYRSPYDFVLTLVERLADRGVGGSGDRMYQQVLNILHGSGPQRRQQDDSCCIIM